MVSSIAGFFKRKFGNRRGLLDYSLLFIVLFLLSFGLVMLYSVSSYEAAVEYKGDAAYYLRRQMVFTVFGLILMAGVSLIPYTFWKKVSVLAYLMSVGLIVLVIPFGMEVNGAKRWIRIPGLPMQLQPAEVAKIGVIILSAMIVEKLGRRALATMRGFVFPMIPALIVARRESSCLAGSAAVCRRKGLPDDSGAVCDRIRWRFWQGARPKHAETGFHSGGAERHDLFDHL